MTIILLLFLYAKKKEGSAYVVLKYPSAKVDNHPFAKSEGDYFNSSSYF